MKIRPWNVFVAKSRRGRFQDRPRQLGDSTFGAFFFPKMALQGPILGSLENQNSDQNHTFNLVCSAPLLKKCFVVKWFSKTKQNNYIQTQNKKEA